MTDPSSMPDRELLTAVAAGDEAAFERLYQRYERRAYQYALSIVRDRTVAEEVVVDAMTSVWHGASGFAGESQVSTWILGIARHKALDALRRGAKRAHNATLEDCPELPSEAETPAETADRVSSTRLARRAMAMLSPDHQEILRLTFFEELPYEEIAVLLSIPGNTVKTRVYYAKQQLKRCIEQLAARELV